MFVDTQQRPQGEQVDAIAPSKMKLSAAIRIGAKIRPQCYGRYFKDGGSCALGAAYEAMTGKNFENSWSGAKQIDAEIWMTIQFGHSVGGIGLQNDNGKTREQIADMLEAQGL